MHDTSSPNDRKRMSSVFVLSLALIAVVPALASQFGGDATGSTHVGGHGGVVGYSVSTSEPLSTSVLVSTTMPTGLTMTQALYIAESEIAAIVPPVQIVDIVARQSTVWSLNELSQGGSSVLWDPEDQQKPAWVVAFKVSGDLWNSDFVSGKMPPTPASNAAATNDANYGTGGTGQWTGYIMIDDDGQEYERGILPPGVSFSYPTTEAIPGGGPTPTHDPITFDVNGL